jgi:hypothetical protein
VGQNTDKPKRKTRLKGTATHKPCVDCGKMKDRFAGFRPRWAGCASHRTERGRRYHEPGCDECEKLVNGNIRQPRCTECDKARPKKRNTKAETTVEPKTLTDVALVSFPDAVLLPASSMEPEDLLGVPVMPEPEPEPVVTAHEEPSLESVQVPEPEPEPTPASVKKARPKIASMADLSKLFDEATSD